MPLAFWSRLLGSATATPRRRARLRPAPCVLRVECLEDRTLPSAGVGQALPMPGRTEAHTGLPTVYVPGAPRPTPGGDAQHGPPEVALAGGSDTAGNDGTPNDRAGDSYPIPPATGPTQRGGVGVSPAALALLLPLRGAPGVEELSLAIPPRVGEEPPASPQAAVGLVPDARASAPANAVPPGTVPPRETRAGLAQGLPGDGPALDLLLTLNTPRPADGGPPASGLAETAVGGAPSAYPADSDRLFPTALATAGQTAPSGAGDEEDTPALAGDGSLQGLPPPTNPGRAPEPVHPAGPPERADAGVPWVPGLLRRLVPLLFLMPFGIRWYAWGRPGRAARKPVRR
jgi:hypothetical protein